jgi:hypothetical protein
MGPIAAEGLITASLGHFVQAEYHRPLQHGVSA